MIKKGSFTVLKKNNLTWTEVSLTALSFLDRRYEAGCLQDENRVKTRVIGHILYKQTFHVASIIKHTSLRKITIGIFKKDLRPAAGFLLHNDSSSWTLINSSCSLSYRRLTWKVTFFKFGQRNVTSSIHLRLLIKIESSCTILTEPKRKIFLDYSKWTSYI